MARLKSFAVLAMVYATMVCLWGCSPAAIAAAGSTASAQIQTDAKNGHIELSGAAPDVRGADAKFLDILDQLPAVDKAVAQGVYYANLYDGSWFGGKAHRAFWTLVFIGIALVLGGIVLVALTGAAGLQIPGAIGAVFGNIEKFLSGIFPLSAWVSHWFSAAKTTKAVAAASTTTISTASTTVPAASPVTPAASITTTTTNAAPVDPALGT